MRVIPVLIVAFIFLLVAVVIGHRIGRIKIPFTEKTGLENGGSSMITVISGMAVIGLGAALNYAVLSNIYLLSCYGAVLLIIAVFLWKKGIKAY